MRNVTPTQRKFRKQIKDLEKDGKIPDNYAPRRERGSYRRPISILTILFLLWNSYALYTWIAPRFNKTSNSGTYYVRESRYENNSITNFAARSKHKKIRDYMNMTKNITDEFNLITKKISDHISGIAVYSIGDIHSNLTELNYYREQLESSNFVDFQINELYLSSVGYLEQVLFNLDKSPSEINQNFNEFRNVTEQIREALIEFLVSNEIEYVINGNGTLTYYTME